MSFDTPAGTHGGRQPRAGLLLRLINNNAASRFRRTGKMLGFNGLILTTVGARSGAGRTSPVGWWPGPDGSWLISEMNYKGLGVVDRRHIHNGEVPLIGFIY